MPTICQWFDNNLYIDFNDLAQEILLHEVLNKCNWNIYIGRHIININIIKNGRYQNMHNKYTIDEQ